MPSFFQNGLRRFVRRTSRGPNFRMTSVVSGMTTRFTAMRTALPRCRHLARAAHAMPRRVERRVRELASLARGAQHQSAARHVAESREERGEAKAVAENRAEDVDVF